MSHKHASRGPSTPRRGVARLGLLVVGLLLVATTAFGCGESDAEKAQTQVCDARTDLQKQVDDLAALTPATATADGVKANVSAIENDLKQIRDAQGDLNDERKQQVESATQAFAAEVKTIGADLRSDLSASGAQAKLQAAGQQLASSYQQTFAKIDCG